MTLSSGSEPSSPSESISTFLSSLPQSSNAFTKFDATYPPSEPFTTYISQATDTATAEPIGNEKTRCLIRALKARPPPRKRSLQVQNKSNKRRRWTNLDRDKKQACLRVALAAACQGGKDTGILGELRRGWLENPRKKQVVDARVRRALCDSLDGWSMAQLGEYLDRAGVERGGGRSELTELVRRHLAPEE